MDRGAWWATVHGVAESWTWLSDTHTHTHTQRYVRVCLEVQAQPSEVNKNGCTPSSHCWMSLPGSKFRTEGTAAWAKSHSFVCLNHWVPPPHSTLEAGHHHGRYRRACRLQMTPAACWPVSWSLEPWMPSSTLQPEWPLFNFIIFSFRDIFSKTLIWPLHSPT